jgi:hypothetical protein
MEENNDMENELPIYHGATSLFASLMYLRENRIKILEEGFILDKDKDILGFIRMGYEPFHLMGDEVV